MRFLKLYARVLAQLRAEGGLALALVAANIAVAFAQFAEPLLLGRVVDKLASAQGRHAPVWGDVAPLLALWGGFGLFVILAGVAVALYSDRLAQRRRMAAMADFFAHLLNLPASYHAGDPFGPADQDHARRARTRCSGCGSRSSASIAPPSSR